MKDDATPALDKFRKQLRKARDDLRGYTDRLAKSFGSSEYATFSGSRHMLVLPREKCKGREGIVHSTSHSGGSLYFETAELVQRNKNHYTPK